MSPIARATRLQTPAERLDSRIWTDSSPAALDQFIRLMLRIGMTLHCGVAPAKQGPG